MTAPRRWRRWGFEGLLLFVLIGALTYSRLSPRGIAEPDTLYHFKVASLILRDGGWVDIKWLPYTILGNHGPDHHWLWHVALAPFTLIDDPWQAIVVAASVTCAAVPTVILLVCRALAVPLAPVFALFAIYGAGLPERLTRLRSEGLVFMLLSLALLAMARQRVMTLAILSFVFMQAYHGAVLLVPMALLFTLAARAVSQTWPLRNIIAVAGGFTLALAISPWFPQNVSYLLFHTLFKLRSQNLDLIGNEWLQPSWLQIVQFSWMNHLLLLSALLLFLRRRSSVDRSLRLSPETLTAMAMAAVCLFLYRDAVRNVSYYTLFVALASALLVRDSAIGNSRRPWTLGLAGAASAAAAATLYLSGRDLAKVPFYPQGLTRFEAIVSDIEEHAGSDAVVFNVDWGHFGFLFWQSDRLRYVSGLDGNYLAYGDPRRFKIWYDVFLGLPLAGGTANVLRREFNTEWVVVPRGRRMDALAEYLVDQPDTTLQRKDQDGWLIHLDVAEETK